MRVLSALADSRIGGPQLRSLRIAKSLREDGIETEFLLPYGSDKFQERAEEHGFVVHRPFMPRVKPPKQILRNLAVLGSSPLSVYEIRNIIRKGGFDVAHVNMSVNARTAIAAQGTGVSVVWHFNDTVLPPPLKNVAGLLGYNLADQIVVSCSNVSEYYFGRYDIKTEIIHPPVNIEAFDPSNHSPPDDFCRLVDQSVPTIGAVGNVNPVKGYEYLIPAIRYVIDEFGAVNLVIVGERMESQQWYLDKIDTLVDEHDISNNVEFLGYRDDIGAILAALDVFVMPSISETGPMSLMEAMVMEVPAVTTNVGIVPDHLTDEDAWIVPTKDPEALADATTQVLTNPGLANKRASASAQKARRLFSVSAISERHRFVYRSLIN